MNGTTTRMTVSERKRLLREKVWNLLEARGVARFDLSIYLSIYDSPQIDFVNV